MPSAGPACLFAVDSTTPCCIIVTSVIIITSLAISLGDAKKNKHNHKKFQSDLLAGLGQNASS